MGQAAARLGLHRRHLLTALLLAGCELTNGGADGGGGLGGGGMGGAGGNNAMACGFAEPEPNDTRESATAYTAGSEARGCLGSASDVDFYRLSSPADVTGGVFSGAITEVGDGTLSVRVFSASDNAAILQDAFTFTPGASLYFYWAAAPGQEFRIAVSRAGGGASAFKYDLEASYTRVEDPFEPNDTRDLASALTLGTPVMAKLFAGHRSGVVPEAQYYDWYRIDVPRPGRLVVAVDSVPMNTTARVQLHNALGAVINNTTGEEFNLERGGSVMAGYTVMAGIHTVRVEANVPKPETAARLDTPGLPDHATRSYRLTVSQ